MDPMLLKAVIALAPVLVCLAVFERVDAFRLIGLREIALLLIGGGVLAAASFFANGSVLDQFPLRQDSYTQIVAPVVEESMKACLLIGLFAYNRIGYLIDAAIAGFAVGAGFSVAENLFYLHEFTHASLGVWLVRGFGTAVMHGGAAAIFAVLSQVLYAPRLRIDAARFRFNILLFLPGLAAAIALHAGFNHFTSAPLTAMAVVLLAVPLGLFGIFAAGERYAHRWLAENRQAHGKLLADIDSGAFAASNNGRALGALAERLGPEGGRDLFDYVRLNADLVVRAETNLLALEDHEAQAFRDDVRERFRQLHALERRLGLSPVMAVRQHLHFSRNDLWEMHELETHAPSGKGRPT
jgi:RsiW-degrading membrane proteinase PrsW (M82 family)